MVSAMRLWVMLLLRCTLTRSPLTPTSMLWPTTTRELALMLQRLTRALLSTLRLLLSDMLSDTVWLEELDTALLEGLAMESLEAWAAELLAVVLSAKHFMLRFTKYLSD